jgi:glycosyltransferase involved in cell wall biosynthesis
MESQTVRLAHNIFTEHNNRIAILHYTSPPVMGGVEAVIEAHARQLIKDGYEVTIIAGRGDSGIAQRGFSWGANFLLINEMDSLHPETLKLSAELKEGKVPIGFDAVADKLTNVLAPILQEFEHIFIHNLFTKNLNLPLTVALYRLLDKGYIRHLINWCHDFTWGSPNSGHEVHPGYPWDYLRSFRPDVTYVTVSHQRQQMLARLLTDLSGLSQESILQNIRVILNGVDPYRLLGLSPTSQILVDKIDLWDSDLILLMPVRISQAKNIEYAVKLVAELKGLGSYPKLIVTGPVDAHNPLDVERFEKLKDQSRKLNIGENVHFIYGLGPDPLQPNYIDYEIVGELYRIADIVFMPSHREGFGIPVFEAALARVPVVCSNNVPAAREVGETNLIVFDLSTSPRTLANRILRRQSKDPLHIIRQTVRQKYTWEAIYQNDIRPLLQN